MTHFILNYICLIFFQSDSLVSLLPAKFKVSHSSSSLEVSSPTLPTVVSQTELSGAPAVVGPTTTELESFKELIQFDHEYFKPQPMGKVDSNGQTKVKIPVEGQVKNKKILPANKNDTNVIKNVKVIITADHSKGQTDTSQVIQVLDNEAVLDLNLLKYEPESELTSDMLNDLNFDLLDDLEKILKADAEGLSCPSDNVISSQESNKTHVLAPCTTQRGVKRKHSMDEIDTIVESLKQEVPSPSSLNVDSDYSSVGVPSPYSVGSPYSTTDITSPDLEDSPLADTNWEESFTELFPDLL